MSLTRTVLLLVAALALGAAALSLLSRERSNAQAGRGPRVVTTTTVVADWARQVAGHRADVHSLVPSSGDPHTYSPGPRDVARIQEADLVLPVGLTLEAAWLDKLLQQAAPDPSRIVPLGEHIQPIPFEGPRFHRETDERVLFLGLNLEKVGKGLFNRDEVVLRLADFQGPGAFVLYGADSFGDPEVHVNTRDGVNGADLLRLRAGSHVHLNWVFTAEGVYRLTFEAQGLLQHEGSRPVNARMEYTFVVGASAESGPSLSAGHVDLRLAYENGRLSPDVYDEAFDGTYAPSKILLQVKPEARTSVPNDARFGFLGASGAPLWVLPQGAAASHEHGPHDPHFWFDPLRVKAVLPEIVSRLSALDPEGAELYRSNAREYALQLDLLHQWVLKEVAKIPRERRLLVTSHEAFGYLAGAYGFKVVGAVIPGGTTAREPSAADLTRLVGEIRAQRVPAVFTETIVNDQLARRVAEEAGVRIVTKLYTDSLGPSGSGAETYIDMMRHNISAIVEALR